MNCRQCGKLITAFRCHKFCCKKCRDKYHNEKNFEYQKEWQRSRRGGYAPNKKKCAICGKWYVQVGSHIVQRHKMTARQYREFYNLPVKKGITCEDFRELKGRQALENGTYKNLKKGKKY